MGEGVEIWCRLYFVQFCINACHLAERMNSVDQKPEKLHPAFSTARGFHSPKLTLAVGEWWAANTCQSFLVHSPLQAILLKIQNGMLTTKSAEAEEN